MCTEVVGRTCKGNIYLPLPWIGVETRKAPAPATHPSRRKTQGGAQGGSEDFGGDWESWASFRAERQ